MLELIEIHKLYENKILLSNISFKVGENEKVCLLGESGSGKSTLLRIIAGLERPDNGRILWSGDDISLDPAHRRNFGLMFQDYALFPHLNVFENVAFGLRMQDLPSDEVDSRVNDSLQMVNMAGFELRRVDNLSGGEQQRIALARALAPRPRLLMFDEPLGALDRSLRDYLLYELRDILSGMGVPVIYVTHDQEEASMIADRMILLHGGFIVQEGAPVKVYTHPSSGWVADFLGLGNVFEGNILKDGQVETPIGIMRVGRQLEALAGESVKLLIRPERVSVRKDGKGWKGRVVDVQFQRNRFRVTLENGLFFFCSAEKQVGSEIAFDVEVEILG